jgi:hypothetical protein
VIGVDVADATLEGYIKYALQGLVAAIGANADMSADIATVMVNADPRPA